MNRRTLIDGLKETPHVDPQVEQQFVKGNRPIKELPSKAANSGSIARSPISTRMRTDFAEALKRASLQRQLDKVEPSSLTEILEAAVEPWLRTNGYLD